MTDRQVNRDVEMQIVQRDGQVILLFSRRQKGELVAAHVDNMNLPPNVALHAAELLTQMAFEADTGLKPVGDTLKATIVERHRMTLTQRFAVMLGTLREDKTKTNGQMAQALVDVALKEVF